MKTVFLLSIILILSFTVNSQDLKTVQIPLGARAKSKKVIDGVTTHIYSQGKKIPVNGNPYLNESFMPGILELHDGSVSEQVPMRFNIADDTFELIFNNDTLALNQPLKVNRIYYNGAVYIFDLAMRDNHERKYNGFFQVLVEGDFSLYVKKAKEIEYDNFVSNYQGGSGTKEYYYVDKLSYIGRFKGRTGFLINSKRELLKYLAEKKPSIKTYFKNQKIKVKNEDDLIALVKYYNSLQ